MKYIAEFRPEIITNLDVEEKFIKPFLHDGYTITARTPTGFHLKKPSGGTISEVDESTFAKRVVHPREFIRRHYKKNDVTKADFDRLVIDLQNGEVSFDEIYKFNKWLKSRLGSSLLLLFIFYLLDILFPLFECFELTNLCSLP